MIDTTGSARDSRPPQTTRQRCERTATRQPWVTSGQGPFVDELWAQNTPIVLLKHVSVPIGPVRDFRAMREARAVLSELRPDVVTTHSSKAGILGRLAGRSLRIPVVFTAHGWAFTSGVPLLRASMYREFERIVGPLARRIITVSEFDRRLESVSDGHTGYTVPQGGMELLRNRIGRLLADPSLRARLGASGRTAAQISQFDITMPSRGAR